MTHRKNKIFARLRNSTPWVAPKMTLLLSTGLVLSGCATVQSKPELNDRLLQKINEQDQKIAERDKAISDLTRRIQNLESRSLAATAQPSPASPKISVAAAEAASPEASTTTAPTASQPSDSKPVQTASAQPGPGSFEVDENAAQRALERTLVQSGALLLPKGLVEIQPFVTYARREREVEILQIPLTVDSRGRIPLVSESTRRNEFDMGANVLVGLPFESQLELRIPYRSVNQSVVESRLNSPTTENTGNSIGDIRIGLAKTVFHETEWLPDLIGRLTWDTATSDISSNGVAMGSGFNDFIASLTALKRQDPLAFTATVAYQASLERQGIKPGDQATLAFGATLAASPQTSLSIGLQQTYIKALRQNGVQFGSDRVSSAFTFGGSSTIGRNLFVSLTGGIGLTNDSPDYFFNIMLPFRFDAPSTYRQLTSSKP